MSSSLSRMKSHALFRFLMLLTASICMDKILSVTEEELQAQGYVIYYPELPDPDDIVKHARNLFSKFGKDTETFTKRLHGFAALIYTGKFSDCTKHEDWMDRLYYLCGHHFRSTGMPPEDGLFRSAQMTAFQVGNRKAAKMIYKEHHHIIGGMNTNPSGNKLSNMLHAHTPIILEEASTLTQRMMARPEDFTGLVQEHLLGFPQGLDGVIDFAARKLLLREKSIQDSLRLTAHRISHNSKQNFLLVLFGHAMAKKQVLVTSCLRILLEAKRMTNEDEKRRVIGELAARIVRQRFTNKLPDEMLAMLKGWERLSPFWFYAHSQLDLILMDIGRTKEMNVQRLNAILRPQILYENTTFSSVVLALRSESPEPYRSNLPIVIYDFAGSADVQAYAMMRKCIDMMLGGQRMLDQINTKFFFLTALPAAVKDCAVRTGATICKPLSPSELSDLTYVKPAITLKEDWFPSKQQAKTRVNTKPKTTSRPKTRVAVAWGRDTVEKGDNETGDKKNSESPINSALEQTVPESSDSYDEPKTSSGTDSSSANFHEESMPVEATEATKTKPSEKVESSSSHPRTLSDLLRPVTIDLEYDEEAAAHYTRQYYTDIFNYEEQKKMSQYEYDAFKDAAKTLTLHSAPQIYCSSRHSVEFFSKDDFLALHLEAREVYETNFYNNLVHLGQNDAGIKLRWIFAPEVEIGQDTFRFLCQVFGLDQGSSLLKFSEFVKAFDKLTDTNTASASKRPTRSTSNSLVFRFNHSFMIDGKVCLPPIEEIHPEHESSGFNHVRARDFLMHGGAHPYFFRVIHSKYALLDPAFALQAPEEEVPLVVATPQVTLMPICKQHT